MSVHFSSQQFARRSPVASHEYQPFATNNTVTKGTKLPESRTVIRKLSFALGPRRLIFVYGGAIFALPEAFFFKLQRRDF